MKIVIDIPDAEYERIQAMDWKNGDRWYSPECVAIHNGIPLPEGHGDLIDRDAVNNRYDSIYAELHSYSNQPTYKELLDKLSMCLDTAPTIIESDKENRND